DNLEDDVLLVSKKGQVIRLHLKTIPIIGRATQGVRIMRLNGEDQIASVALMQSVAADETENSSKDTPKA
ncbi:MAG TPA: DNA gyrase C-terminal beta-propeller domain-containing protein, partial [Candidatus Saccharibacteria bacterium]|nr:DNA gyrase C-terminal beta-propeller domain-containing protein [Candidatus Saccharibacteria bacterium]